MFVITETIEGNAAWLPGTQPIAVSNDYRKVLSMLDEYFDFTCNENKNLNIVFTHAWYNFDGFTTAPHLGGHHAALLVLLLADGEGNRLYNKWEVNEVPEI